MTSLLLFVCPWDWLVQASRDSPYRNAKVTDPKDSNSGLNACTATAFFSMVQLPKPLQCSLFTLRIQTGYHLWNYYKAIYHFVLKEKKRWFPHLLLFTGNAPGGSCKGFDMGCSSHSPLCLCHLWRSWVQLQVQDFNVLWKPHHPERAATWYFLVDRVRRQWNLCLNSLPNNFIISTFIIHRIKSCLAPLAFMGFWSATLEYWPRGALTAHVCSITVSLHIHICNHDNVFLPAHLQ